MFKRTCAPLVTERAGIKDPAKKEAVFESMKQFDFSAMYEMSLAGELVCGLSKNARLALHSAVCADIARAAIAGDMEEVTRLSACNGALDEIDVQLTKDSAWRGSELTVAQLNLSNPPRYKVPFDKLPYKERYEVLRCWVQAANKELAQK